MSADHNPEHKIEISATNILIGVGGGIAAYKVCTVVSSLAKSGVNVRVMLTDSAQAFITPLTLATLARHPAYTDQDFWQANQPRPLHIALGEWADIMLLAPLTANTLGKLTHGLADNLLTNTVLASTCPVLLAPAMNTDMWQQATVQRNWLQLQQDPRYHALAPGSGILACDRVGTGRMAEPIEILAYLTSLQHTGGKRDLAGQRILINTGGTREHLDPVRFLSNPSTGKMGVALAQAALHRGATVTLVHAPMDADHLAAISGIQTRSVTSANDMKTVMLAEAANADWIILAAAIADIRPATYHDQKLPKQELPESLPLWFNPDIALELSQQRQPHQKFIGFAAQTGDFISPAKEKLTRKGFDAIAANPIDQPNSGFGSNTNQAVLIDRHGRERAIAPCSKLQLAHHLFDFCQGLSST